MNKLIVGWDAYHSDCQALAKTINKNTYGRMLAISRGGLIVGGILSYLLNIKNIDTICLESYTDDDRRMPLNVIKGPLLPATRNTLIVDDIVDSSTTYNFIMKVYPDVDFAALYIKKGILKKPKFVGRTISSRFWVVFPYD